MKSRTATILALLIAVVGAPSPTVAQEPTYFDYLASVPPLVGRHTVTDDVFQLYTLRDPSATGLLDPGRSYLNRDYRDNLIRLAAAFSPVLRRNNFSVPRRWQNALSVPGTRNVLHVDTWDAGDFSGELITAERLAVDDFGTAATAGVGSGSPQDSLMRSKLGAAAGGLYCDPDDEMLVKMRGGMAAGQAAGGRRALTPDETVMLLLAEALCPGSAPVVRPAAQTQRVLYFDFPGEDPQSWKRAHAPIPRSTSSIYAHFFVYDNSGTDRPVADEWPRYSFVIQYWFFYPFNDGGNNHEGDWEHLNVVVTTADKALNGRLASDGWLTRTEVLSILNGQTSPDATRIARMDYYFHNAVYTFDYLQLGVYEPDSLYSARPEEDRVWLGEDWIRNQLKRRTNYGGDTIVNNHPFAYIGGNNVGLDQLLAGPGDGNTNSHGSYPFPGTWKRVGPIGATERLNGSIGAERDFFDDRIGAAECHGKEERDYYLCYDADHIKILPDWEHINFGEPDERAEWYWLALPIRWGQPTTASPGSGLIRHFDIGNNAPIGPTRNSGWNNLGTARSYAPYEAHALPEYFQLAPQDQFSTELGALNTVKLVATFLTPGHLGASLYRAFGSKRRRFAPTLNPPSRAVSLSFGPSLLWGGDLVRIRPLDPLTDAEVGGLDDGSLLMLDWHSDPRVRRSFEARVGLHVGHLFSNETVFATSETNLKSQFASTALSEGDPINLELGGETRTYTVANEIRVALLHGGFKPYGKAGYGYTWIHIHCDVVTADQAPAACADDVRRDHGWTWLVGGGIEFTGVGTHLGGWDIGLRLDYTRGWTHLSPDWNSAWRNEHWLDTNRFALLFVVGK